jgi:phosphoserine phosphatase
VIGYKRPVSAGLAFFDMDGTLVAGDCGVLFVLYCARRGLLPARELGAWLPWLLRVAAGGLREAEAAQAKRLLLRSWVRLGEARADALYDACFEALVRPRLRRAVCDQLRAAQGEGPVVIVTANLGAMARRLGRELGVPAERCLGAEGRRDGGGQLDGEVLLPLPMGEERAAIVRAQAALLGVPIERVRAFGDSMNDLPMLRAAGRACAVHPGRRLLRAARAEGFGLLR